MITKQQIKKLSPSKKTALLRKIFSTFDKITVTGLYGSEATIVPDDLITVEQGSKRINELVIATDLCTD